MDGREAVLGVSQVDSDKSGARIQLSVKDTGIGIPKESQDRVFGEFEQADQSATRVHGGSGLGLTTSRRLEVGDEEIVDTTLAVYASEAPGIMARITNAVTSGNCDEMRAGAHSLQSASGTIRAHHLPELLRRLEELGREGEVAATTEFFQEVSAEYHAVMAYLADQ